MGNKAAKSGEYAVLDWERALDRQHIAEGRLGELWEGRRRLAFHYARLFYRQSGGWAETNTLLGISHEGFLRAIRGWDESRGGFNLMLKMAVREEARRQLRLDRREMRNTPLTQAAEDQLQAPLSAEKLSSDFMDDINNMPDSIRDIAKYCIDNAHKYYSRNHSVRLGLKTGEKNGLLLDACGGSLWRARNVAALMRAWLRGERGGDLVRHGMNYKKNISRINRETMRRKKEITRA